MTLGFQGIPARMRRSSCDMGISTSPNPPTIYTRKVGHWLDTLDVQAQGVWASYLSPYDVMCLAKRGKSLSCTMEEPRGHARHDTSHLGCV